MSLEKKEFCLDDISETTSIIIDDKESSETQKNQNILLDKGIINFYRYIFEKLNKNSKELNS